MLRKKNHTKRKRLAQNITFLLLVVAPLSYATTEETDDLEGKQVQRLEVELNSQKRERTRERKRRRRRRRGDLERGNYSRKKKSRSAKSPDIPIPKSEKCVSGLQRCIIFDWFSENDECPDSTDFCPKTMEASGSKHVTCLNVGEYCKYEVPCGGIKSCCDNCANLVAKCCPEICTSCLTIEQRCDMFKVATQYPQCDGQFGFLKHSLCYPRGQFPCGTQHAKVYCETYVGDDGGECFDNCMEVVDKNQCCQCLNFPVFGGNDLDGMMNDMDDMNMINGMDLMDMMNGDGMF